MRGRIAFAVMATVLLGTIAGPVRAGNSAIDDNFFAYYAFANKGKTVDYLVCASNGCGGDGQLEKFKRACAVLEGAPSTNGNVVTRAVYILDKGQKTTDPVMLDVYTRTDTINGDQDSAVLTLNTRVSLGITAGAKARCTMAANGAFVYAGTDLSGAIRIDKNSFAVQATGFGNISTITADERGYVTISETDGLYGIFSASGGLLVEGGGGPFYMPNTNDAFTSN